VTSTRERSVQTPAPRAGTRGPEGFTKAYYLQRTRFEGIATWKIRRRQLTEDGGGQISALDWR
jgi:hypothetical protein